MEAIRWVKHYIREGHVYQINLSQIFTFPWHYSPESLYKKIRLTNPAPFGAFFKYADWAILSTSPERFLYRVNNVISTEPIKGTMPRGRTPEEDEANVRDLLSSIKERAEHIMIVDLLRNDLGRICEYGTVHVEDRFYVEKYRSVHQLISRVVGRLRSDASLGFVLAETFPGGSITGAPKIRAMEIIAESEPHKRSAYTGTIGRVSINRNNFDLSILIRTIIMQKGFAALSLGGGIVFDSEELAEYQETIDKGAAIVHALHF
jgi:para-aminobenzoate synthetase component 1